MKWFIYVHKSDQLTYQDLLSSIMADTSGFKVSIRSSTFANEKARRNECGGRGRLFSVARAISNIIPVHIDGRPRIIRHDRFHSRDNISCRVGRWSRTTVESIRKYACCSSELRGQILMIYLAYTSLRGSLTVCVRMDICPLTR